MRIRLDSEYALVGDADQVTLVHTRRAASGKQAGQIVQSPVGYYRDVPQALEAFATRKARMSDVPRDDDYIAKLETEVDRFVTEMLELEAQLRGDAEELPFMDDLEGAA